MSAGYTRQEYAQEHKLPLPLAHVVVACTVLDDAVLNTVEELNKDHTTYASIIPEKLAHEKGLEALISAHIAAYTAYKRGLRLARRKDLNTLLALLGTRNIREAILRAARPGEKVVIIVASKNPLRLPWPPCSLPKSTRLAVTSAALHPLEARLYKPTQVVKTIYERTLGTQKRHQRDIE